MNGTFFHASATKIAAHEVQMPASQVVWAPGRCKPPRR